MRRGGGGLCASYSVLTFYKLYRSNQRNTFSSTQLVSAHGLFYPPEDLLDKAVITAWPGYIIIPMNLTFYFVVISYNGAMTTKQCTYHMRC